MNKDSKKCPKCKRILTYSEFHKNRSTKNGLSSWCKECNNNYGKKHRMVKNPNYKPRFDPYFNVPKGMKCCTKCKNILPISDFCKKNSIKRDRLNSWCRKCCRKCYQELRKNHPELIRKWEKNRNKKIRRKSQRIWVKDNPEKIGESRRKFYKNNSEKIKKYVRNWQKNNPEKVMAYITKRNRNLGYFELFDNPFPEEIPINFHHINDFIVIPMPDKLHRSYNNPNSSVHRQKCSVILERIYGVDFNTILQP